MQAGAAPSRIPALAPVDEAEAAETHIAPAPTLGNEAAAAAPADAASTEAVALPTECARRKNGAVPTVCTPPSSFVVRLCGGAYPDVALALFSKGTPWTRAYASRDVEAWDASRRGRSSSNMARDEEVIVLVDRTGGSNIVVGSGSYDVLRWDGSCSSLMADELTFAKPPQAGHAEVPWRRLDNRIRDVLSADRLVSSADADHRRVCRGATLGAKSAACRQAEHRLDLLVVAQVRKGVPLPPPEHLP